MSDRFFTNKLGQTKDKKIKLEKIIKNNQIKIKLRLIIYPWVNSQSNFNSVI